MCPIHVVSRGKNEKNGKDLDEPINNVINTLLLLYWAHDVVHNVVYLPIYLYHNM